MMTLSGKKRKLLEMKCYREVSDALARQLEPLKEAHFPVAVKESRLGLQAECTGWLG